MNRITWGAVIMHALAGFAVSAVGCGLSVAAGVSAWPAGLVLALASTAFWTWREAKQAAARYDTDLRTGLGIVFLGEGGEWSEWNLRLQALSPLVGGLLVTAYVATAQ
jgi:hypothetical protein